MSTVKVNWGLRVTLMYFGFVALIATLVYKSMHTDFDLVSTDYYNEELKYQEVIDASKNQANLSAAVSVKLAEDSVRFSFPMEFAETSVTGKMHFYSEVNEKWDRKYPLHTSNGVYSVSAKELTTTTYRVKLYWTSNEKSYFQETIIKIH